MKKIFMISFVLLYLTTFSQVSITKSDFTSQFAVGNSFTIYNDTTSQTLDIGSTGENTWDFSALSSDFAAQTSDITVSSAPETSTFTEATSVVYSTATIQGISIDTWTYPKIETDKVIGLGFHIENTSSNVQMTTTTSYDPAETVYQLPLTFGASWTDTGDRNIESEVGGYTSNSTEGYSITKTVDAWGTLTMPNGTTKDVLRITVESDFTTTTSGTSETTHNVYYEFISKDGLYVEVNSEDYNQPQNGAIRVVDISWHYAPNTTGVEKKKELAKGFSLEQNYPNPFNPTTNIEYSIPKQAHVTLKVYDVLGNEVATLVNRELSAGVYNSKFDGSKLSSGIYFYTLSADNFIETKKLLLVK